MSKYNFLGTPDGSLRGLYMSTETAFLNAIQAQPEDNTLRLVYADWLEEQGDVRAELIRLEIHLDSLPVYSEEFAIGKVRRNELRQLCQFSWLQALGFVPTHRPMFQHIPASQADRWRLAVEFIETWHGGYSAQEGIADELDAAEQRLGVSLPIAVKEWYKLAIHRRKIWSNQDRMVEPHLLQLDAENQRLVLRHENQGCECWGIRAGDLHLDDPPIYEFQEHLICVTATTSQFALLVLLYESMFGSNAITAGGEVTEELIAKHVVAKFTPSELTTNYWVLRPLSFYEAQDLILQTHNGNWLYAIARTETALAQIDAELWPFLERWR
jgi:uncharacterized protein (TIGR02996 family)